MSATQSSNDRYECDHCGEKDAPHRFFDAAMCSEQCRREADAQSILNTLKYDHTTCSTCYRLLKTIEKPQEQHPEVFIGYQHRTEHAEWGEKSPLKENPDDDPRHASSGDVVYAYEVQDDESNEIREYYPGRQYDFANPLETYDPAEEDVRTATVCSVCGSTDHKADDDDLRAECSTMLVGHHFTERLRELEADVDESMFWDIYAVGGDLHQALEMSLII